MPNFTTMIKFHLILKIPPKGKLARLGCGNPWHRAFSFAGVYFLEGKL